VSRRAARGLTVWALSVVSGVALAAAFPAVLRIPPRDPAAARSVPPAFFSHRTHQSFGCFACHPSTFPQAPLGFRHEEMRAGRFCAQCHQGRIAFAIDGAACEGCHAPSR
jgi:c(7)-type cytochrome triheme protein